MGWTIGTVGNEFELTMGQSPPGSTYNNEVSAPFYQGSTDFGFRFPTRRVYCNAPTRFAEAGDTLVMSDSVGDLNMAREKCCVARCCCRANKSKSRSYTFYTMESLAEDFARYEAEGTVLAP